MNLEQARLILELSEDATQEEAKKKYRELTKKYHPDVNKEAGAEDKFKKINEAYRCVQSGQGTDREEQMDPFHGFDPFGRRSAIDLEPVYNSVTISFQESVQGCKKEVKFFRKTKCPECNGQGKIILNNGCDRCGGRGQISGRQGMMMFTRTCDKCGGRVKMKSCEKCRSTGLMDGEASIQVTIPGGIRHENVLRLGGMGHYAGGFMGMEQHSDAFLQVMVIPDPDLTLEGVDVIGHLTISLLDALRGCTRKVRTILGEKEIEIKAQSRNKDEVIIRCLGVAPKGNHKVILNVEYPPNVYKLIDALVSEEN